MAKSVCAEPLLLPVKYQSLLSKSFKLSLNDHVILCVSPGRNVKLVPEGGDWIIPIHDKK